MTFTGKKVVKTKGELKSLFRKLQSEGYRWGSNQSLLNSYDTSVCSEHLPVLLAFDARNKRVYYSTYIGQPVEVDPNYY